MGHAVYYRDAAGKDRFEPVDSLDDGLELVERLRNDGSASDVRVFREVPIEVRTYYRVVAVEPSSEVEAVVVAGPAPVEALDPPTGQPGDVAGKAGDEPQAPAPVTPTVPAEAPSGAMVMTPPPVTVHAEVEAETVAAHESRRPLFSRS